VTMRGSPVARLSPLEGRDPLAQLRARGLVSEPTGEWDELWSTSALRISSQLVYPEARAALAAAERQGRIDRRGLRRAVSDLEQATAAMRLIGVDHALAYQAGSLAERHALRGYDAVHLASALLIDEPELLIATWDRELAAAARDSGRPVAPALPNG
jgi:predicted nucleic acid-binding protein